METADLFERRRDLKRTVRLYFEACTESSREKFVPSLAEDAVSSRHLSLSFQTMNM